MPFRSPKAGGLPQPPAALWPTDRADMPSALSKGHPRWRPDRLSASCLDCESPFHALLLRRHHCRRCGFVFCGACAHARLPYANCESPQRTCRLCRNLVASGLIAKSQKEERERRAAGRAWDEAAGAGADAGAGGVAAAAGAVPAADEGAGGGSHHQRAGQASAQPPLHHVVGPHPRRLLPGEEPWW